LFKAKELVLMISWQWKFQTWVCG